LQKGPLDGEIEKLDEKVGIHIEIRRALECDGALLRFLQ